MALVAVEVCIVMAFADASLSYLQATKLTSDGILTAEPSLNANLQKPQQEINITAEGNVEDVEKVNGPRWTWLF